jgi:hypothetical protein
MMQIGTTYHLTVRGEMSRGPGVRQRALLEAVEGAGRGGVFVTHGLTPTEGASFRRAAYKLADAGHLQLRVRHGKLVAYAVGIELAEDRYVIGLDGRPYHSDSGAPGSRKESRAVADARKALRGTL